MTIWKYHFPIADEFTICMPPGSEPLTVQVQGGEPVMWAVVDEALPPQEVQRFYVVGTGYQIPKGADAYLGTIQLEGLVWHVFEERRP